MVRMRMAAAIGYLLVALVWAGCSSTDNHPKGAAGAAGHGGGTSDDGGPRDPDAEAGVADVSADVSPEGAPDVAAEAMSDVTIEVTSDVAIEVSPDGAIEASPDVAPEATPDVVPEGAADVQSALVEAAADGATD